MAFDFLDDLDSPIPMESNYWKNLDDKQRRKEFEIRERVGTVAPEKDGILTELKQGAHGAALDTLRGIGSTLEETTGYSGMREYFDEVKARNRHLDPYEGYKAASLDPTNIARTIGSGAAQSALSLGAGMATTALTGNVVAGGAVMTGTMFMQLYGDRVKDYRERMPEQDEGTVKGLAFVSAVGESLIESVCGPEAAFNGIAKRLVTGALKDTTKSFVKHVGKEAAKNFIMEGSEEVVQDMWDRVCLRAGTENVTLPSWDEVKETFMGGAWSGLALGGIGGAVENIASRKGNTQAGTAAALPAAEKSAAQTVERSAVPAPEKETANSTPGNPDRNEGRTFAEALYDELGIRHSRTEDGMKGVTQDGETGEANGFYDKDTNEIKINPDNEGEVFSHGHELDHWLSRNHADLAEQLHQVMDEELNEAGKAEQDGRSPQELRADMLGRIMEDPETALRIAQRGDELHVGFGEKFLKSIQEFAKKMMAFAKSHADLKGAEQYFNDYKRVRDTVAGLIVELRRRNGTSTEAENVVGVKGSDMVQSIPVADLNIDPARFQFKSKANKETGVDESNKLGGEWDPKTAGNLYVWEDKSGKKFVVNGHHRFQLAKNSRVQAVNAIVDREADGVSAEQARRNGVLINIRDEQGDVKDYADFVRHEDMSEETAEKEGILAREKGRRGYTIGKYASDNLYSIFKSDEISEAKAETIADIARKDEGLEAAGIRAAKTMPNAQLREFLKCLKNMPREKNEQGDLFGFDDSAIQMSEKLSKLAAKHIREIADKLKAVRQAVKNPETAAKGDVKVGKNAQKIYDQTLRDQLEWEHWYTNPELSAQLRKEAGIEETPEAPAVKENLTTAEEISDVGDIIGKTGARTNARIDALRNLKDGKYHAFGLTFEKVTTERSVYDEANPDRKMNEVSFIVDGKRFNLMEFEEKISKEEGKESFKKQYNPDKEPREITNSTYERAQKRMEQQASGVVTGRNVPSGPDITNQESGRFNMDSDTPLLTPEEDSRDFQLFDETPEEARAREAKAERDEAARLERAKEEARKAAPDLDFSAPTEQKQDADTIIRNTAPGSAERVKAFVELPDGEHTVDGKKFIKSGYTFERDGQKLSARGIERSFKDVPKSESYESKNPAEDAKLLFNVQEDVRKILLDGEHTDLERAQELTRVGIPKNVQDELFKLAREEKSKENIYLKMPIERVRQDAENGVKLAQDALKILENQTQQKNEAPKSAKIEDFGEKIGGARKDLAEKTGPRNATQKKENSDEPKWKKNYLIDQLQNGKWAVFRSKAGLMMLAARNMFDTREEAENSLPAVYVADKFRFYTNKDGKIGLYKFVPSSRTAVPLKGGFDSKEAAMRWALQHVDELEKIRATYGERDLALKPDYERTGERRLNHDATAKDFADAFGFRGVEFGNWENQRERQQLMNDAYEALHDLAELLNIPARGISLDGQLGLAFGSRGHGGSARAHYESDHVVINLTKPSGAGSFAHEWFHALDNYFRKQALGSNTPVHEYLSDKTRLPEGSGMRQELFEKFEALKKSIMENDRPPTEAEQSGYRKNIEYRKDNLKTAIAELRQRLISNPENEYRKRKIKPATEEQLKKFDEISARLLSDDAPKMEWNMIGYTNSDLEALSELYKGITGSSGFTKDGNGQINKIAEHLYWLQRSKERLHKRIHERTSFHDGALELDKYRSEGYWSHPWEMFARAFSAFIEDKLAAEGRRSEFLSYGSDNNLYNHWSTDEANRARAFPEGEERTRINKAFQEFFDELKHKKNEKGNVRLYSLKRTKEISNMVPAEISAEQEKQIREAYDYVMNGEPVARLTGQEFQKDGTPLTEKVTRFYQEQYNGKAVHPELGEVKLDLEGVKDSLGHGIGSIKAAAYAAVPQMIENGKIFDRQKNWKGRGYDTVVMAAPLEIGGVPYVGEVIVEQRPNRQGFYLHEVEVKEKLANAFKTPTEGSASPVSRLIISHLIEKIKSKSENIQKFSSASTSLNQVAAGLKMIDFAPDTTNLDIGGGKYDAGTQYLAEKGVKNIVFDPFNRNTEENSNAFDRIKNGGVDTVTCNNVLNVIAEKEQRSNVILQAAKSLKQDGTAYFTVYEGDGSGVGKQSQNDAWQNNRKTADYVDEIKQHFADVVRHGKLIIAQNPIVEGKLSSWSMDGSSENSMQYSLKRKKHRQVNPIIEEGKVRQEYADLLNDKEYTPEHISEWDKDAVEWITRQGGVQGAAEQIASGTAPMERHVANLVREHLLNSEIAEFLSPELRQSIAEKHIDAGMNWGREGAARRLAALTLKSIDNARAVFRKLHENMPDEDLKKLRNDILDREDVDIFNLPPDIINDKKKLDAVLRAELSAKSKWYDKGYEYWINAILSAPATHAANVFGNTANAVYELGAKRFAEAAINSIAKRKDGASFGEFKHMWKAFDFKNAWNKAVEAFDLEALTPDNKFRDSASVAIPGKTGRAIRTPGRLLVAADAFARELLIPVEAASRAYREAKAQGLKGREMQSYVEKQMANPASKAYRAGLESVEKIIFQEDPGSVVQKLIAMKNSEGPGALVLKYMLPFMKTPANIFRQTMRKSQFGIFNLAGETVQALRGKRSIDSEYLGHVAEQILAWGAFLVLGGFDDDEDETHPFITGSSAAYGSAEQKFKTNEIPPYSIRIGDTYYSYKRIEPLAGGLALIADARQAIRDAKNGKSVTSVLADVIRKQGKMISEKSYLDSINQICRFMEDPERNVANFGTNFVSSWVPNAVKQTLNALDDNVGDFKSRERGEEFLKDQFHIITSRAGFTSRVPKVDLFGHEITKEEAEKTGGAGDFLWRLMVPINRRVIDESHPGKRLIANYNITHPETQWWGGIPNYQFTVNKHKYYFGNEDYHEFAIKSGQLAEEKILEGIRRGFLSVENPTEKDIDLIKKIFTRARKEVRDEMYRKRRYSE